jgi:acetolactate synthase-1/3 small subunit
MLIKVKMKPGQRMEIRELAEIFRGRIVDVAHDEVMVEIAGQEKKVEAFIDLMRPFGIVELVRTGRIAMVRSIDRTNHAGTGLRKFAAAEEPS